MRLCRSAFVAGIALVAACGPGKHSRVERAVLRATLVELFATREHAQVIGVWQDPRQQSPTLSAFGGPWDHHDTLALHRVDSTGLGLPFRVERITLGDMERFFRAHPKGWDAWFEAHPGNAGVVEIATPKIADDSAVVIVGRACGEICRTAWRVTLARTGEAWNVSRVEILKLPK